MALELAAVEAVLLVMSVLGVPLYDGANRIFILWEDVLMLVGLMSVRRVVRLGLCLLVLVSSAARAELPEIDWLDLMPAEDLALLDSLPEIEHEGDGPVLLPDEIMTGRVVPEMSDVKGRIPGFVVPLKVVGDMRVLEFFLVPYYGACIHVPPPPPNQIIHVTYKDGFELRALTDPVWIEGTLVIENTENEFGKSSYSMDATSVSRYNPTY